MKQRNQQGFTLLEMLGALIIIGMMLYALTDVWQQGSRMNEQAQAAWHIKTVNDATERYIKQNYETLLSSSSASSGPQITIADLIAGDFLPEGFQDSNVWGQSYEIHIRRPEDNTLSSVILTTGGRESGRAVRRYAPRNRRRLHPRPGLHRHSFPRSRAPRHVFRLR